ncbi:MAG: AAA family ATPase [Uliginosibacterium sp.]|nr:AAA family ATPase [Uliginosibacterium sp.]
MAIKIDVKELFEILDMTPADQNIMLVGKHGIGKSRIIADYYAKKKLKIVSFFLGQMSDPGDLIGLMYKDEKSGHSEFLPPYWWPAEGKPIVLFLDELNRARPEILQSVMDLTLNKTLAGKKLPAGAIIISAVNEGEEYQLTDLDPTFGIPLQYI